MMYSGNCLLAFDVVNKFCLQASNPVIELYYWVYIFLLQALEKGRRLPLGVVCILSCCV